MKYGYYPGCSLHSTGIEYHKSFLAVCRQLEIEIEEIKGWTCCGTSTAHAASHLLSIALPMRNLVLAEAEGYSELAVPCASCFSRFKKAIYETSEDPELARDVEEVIGEKFEGKVKPIHPLESLSERLDDIAALANWTLSHIRVACYYGCLLVRPPEVMKFDECEYPMTMDNVLRAAGIETLDWSCKTDCCGAALALSETDIVLDLSREILEEAKGVGANVIAVACPLCHSNLDTRQTEIEAKYETEYGIPILYFTQLLGLALGVEPKELALNRHIVDPMPLVAKEV